MFKGDFGTLAVQVIFFFNFFFFVVKKKKKKKKEKFPNNQKNLILLKNRNIPQIGPPSGHFGPLHRNTGFNLVIQLFC